MSDFIEWVTHGVRRGQREMDSRTVMALLALVAALTLTAALYLTLTSRTAARGRHIEQLRAKLSHLKSENQQLEVKTAEKSTISTLMDRAAALGFVPAEQVEFLTTH